MNPFEMLEPPPGGLSRLRTRLRQSEELQATRLMLGVSLGVVSTALLLVVFLSPARNEPDFTEALRAAVSKETPAPAVHSLNPQGAVLPLLTGEPQVLMYRTATLPLLRTSAGGP